MSEQVPDASAASLPTEKSGARTDQDKGRVIVGIPSTGRADILTRTVRAIAEQTHLPDVVFISVPDPKDCAIEVLSDLPFPVTRLMSDKGAAVQRNTILKVAGPTDIVLFLDDDFLMATDYVAETVALFESEADVHLATGVVLADGILGRGYSFEEGTALLHTKARPEKGQVDDTYGGYGCNMAVRMAPLLRENLFFDERLPLYSWLEDVDFSRRLAAHGRVVEASSLAGVHLGTKTGRQRGMLLGYSQIANPIYMIRKGSIDRGWGIRHMRRNVTANLVKSLRPEPWVDRRGRLRGNLVALRELVTGRLDPRRVLELGTRA